MARDGSRSVRTRRESLRESRRWFLEKWVALTGTLAVWGLTKPGGAYADDHGPTTPASDSSPTSVLVRRDASTLQGQALADLRAAFDGLVARGNAANGFNALASLHRKFCE